MGTPIAVIYLDVKSAPLNIENVYKEDYFASYIVTLDLVIEHRLIYICHSNV